MLQRSSFAVWRWPKWAWVAAAAAMLACYFLAAPVVHYAAAYHYFEHRFSEPPRAIKFMKATFEPAEWCAVHCKPYAAIYLWEYSCLERYLGTAIH